MNKEIKLAWIAALESGDYLPAPYLLKTPKGFCCLGVLTDLYIKTHKDLVWKEEKALFLAKGDKTTDSAWLPEKVDKWAELKESIILGKLSRMNDDRKSFAEIAKIIEKEL